MKPPRAIGGWRRVIVLLLLPILILVPLLPSSPRMKDDDADPVSQAARVPFNTFSPRAQPADAVRYPPLPAGYHAALTEATAGTIARLVPGMVLPNLTLDSCVVKTEGSQTVGNQETVYPVPPWPVWGVTVDYSSGMAGEATREGLLARGPADGTGRGGRRKLPGSSRDNAAALARCTASLRGSNPTRGGWTRAARGEAGERPWKWGVWGFRRGWGLGFRAGAVAREGAAGDASMGGPAKRAARRASWVDDDPWVMFVGDSTARLAWKSAQAMYHAAGWRAAASSASRWKTPADASDPSASDPSKQSLQNRKRDQDAVLVNGSAAVILSLRFVSGNQLTKMAATCADFTINHDYTRESWPLPSVAGDGQLGWDGGREATWASQPRSLLRGRVRAGRQPDVVVLNSGMWELPSVLRSRRTKNAGSSPPGGFSTWEAFAETLYASRLPAAMRLFSPVEKGGCGFGGRLVWRQTFDSNRRSGDNGKWTARFNTYAGCVAAEANVPTLDAAALHDAMGKPQKTLLTRKKPKLDLVHPSEEATTVTNVALLNMLCARTDAGRAASRGSCDGAACVGISRGKR